jgi:hypothetical protein
MAEKKNKIDWINETIVVPRDNTLRTEDGREFSILNWDTETSIQSTTITVVMKRVEPTRTKD